MYIFCRRPSTTTRTVVVLLYHKYRNCQETTTQTHSGCFRFCHYNHDDRASLTCRRWSIISLYCISTGLAPCPLLVLRRLCEEEAYVGADASSWATDAPAPIRTNNNNQNYIHNCQQQQEGQRRYIIYIGTVRKSIQAAAPRRQQRSTRLRTILGLIKADNDIGQSDDDAARIIEAISNIEGSLRINSTRPHLELYINK